MSSVRSLVLYAVLCGSGALVEGVAARGMPKSGGRAPGNANQPSRDGPARMTPPGHLATARRG
ncbi:hypothetical protein T492DRAFT_1094531 [Pavlovales sp. CCMP2436]|nr:hypothetical protein T492DRAFT_1094531 [Pavlovales sp. CCMP2436]